MFMLSGRVLLAVSPFLLAPAAVAGVLTVGPGAAHAQIADAIAVANDGDVILVRTGTYASFAIDAKSLSVVADAGANVTTNESVYVRNLSSSQTAVVSGIRIEHLFNATPLTLENNAGHVRAQSVTAIGSQYVFGGARPALVMNNCADASFVACDFVGGGPEYGGLGYGHTGAPAILASSSVVTLHDCTARGGDGLFGYSNPPNSITSGQPGEPALEFTGGQLFARGSNFQGGAGGRGQSTSACPTTGYEYATGGGDGGPGIRATGTAATLVDVTTLGGTGGIGGTTGCGTQAYTGVTGLPVDPPSIVPIAAPWMSMAVPAPAREGQQLSFTFNGPPGQRVILATSAGASRTPLFQSVLLLSAPLRRVPMAIIPSGGILTVQLPVPTLAPGVDARLVHAQAAFVDPITAQTFVTSPSVIVMLDQSL